MPPTLTTKSSIDTINRPRFAIVTKALAGEADPEGKPRFKAVASSTITDRDGDEISLKALQQMRDKFRDGITIFTDHENKVANAYGTTDSAEIVQAGSDAKGNTVWDLHISGPVNEPSPTAMQLHQSISGGYVKLGCSIDAFVMEHERKKSGGLSIDGLDVFAASIVGVPANQRSWAQKAVRAIKSFRPDEEDEPVPPETEDEKVPEKDTTEGVAADPATPTTPDESEAGEATEEAKAESPEVEKSIEVCPDCGQSAETTGCDNGFHAVASATDEDATGGQASAEEVETPETAPSAEDEADPAIEQKAAALAPEVAELLGHVEKLVKEIKHLRDENAALIAANATLKAENQTVFGEVELAKAVIEKVMEQPLRAKTAGYVSSFTDVHKLFDPEIAEYLAKRGD
jgi:regulator of replication initiation timing